jgi:hypothetical protein
MKADYFSRGRGKRRYITGRGESLIVEATYFRYLNAEGLL